MKKKMLKKLVLNRKQIASLKKNNTKGGQFYGSASCLTFEETCFCNFNIQAGEELPAGNLCYGELF